jgi:hypothetical protein
MKTIRKVLLYTNNGDDFIECTDDKYDYKDLCISYDYYVDDNGYEVLHGMYDEFLYRSQEIILCHYSHGKLHGKYKEYGSECKGIYCALKELIYNNGLLNGLCKIYIRTEYFLYKCVFTYVNGIKHGPFTIFTGMMCDECDIDDYCTYIPMINSEYNMGKLHGKCVRFFYGDDYVDTYNHHNGVITGRCINHTSLPLHNNNIYGSYNSRYDEEDVSKYMDNFKIFKDMKHIEFKPCNYSYTRIHRSSIFIKLVYEYKCGQIHGIVRGYDMDNPTNIMVLKIYYRHNKICHEHETETYKYRDRLNKDKSYVDIRIYTYVNDFL